MSPPIATPAAPPVPSVKLPIAGEPTVLFDLATLERIETAVDLNVGQIMERLRDLAPTREDGSSEPAVDADAVSRAFSIRFMGGFIAGAVGKSVEQLAALCPPARVLPAFTALVGGFCQAMGQVYSAQDAESPEGNPEARPAAGAG